MYIRYFESNFVFVYSVPGCIFNHFHHKQAGSTENYVNLCISVKGIKMGISVSLFQGNRELLCNGWLCFILKSILMSSGNNRKG